MKARAPISLVAAVDSVDSLTLGSRMEGPQAAEFRVFERYFISNIYYISRTFSVDKSTSTSGPADQSRRGPTTRTRRARPAQEDVLPPLRLVRESE
jgi:hypothetical protein